MPKYVAKISYTMYQEIDAKDEDEARTIANDPDETPWNWENASQEIEIIKTGENR
jgi:hypothetical protein